MEQTHSYNYKKIKYICIAFALTLHILALILFIMFFKFPEQMQKLTQTTPAPILIKKTPPQKPKQVTPPKPIQQKKPAQTPPQPRYQPQIRPLEPEKQQSAVTLNPHEEQEGLITKKTAQDAGPQSMHAQQPTQPPTKEPVPSAPEKPKQEHKETTKSQKLIKALKRNKNSKSKWFRTTHTQTDTPQKKPEQRQKTFEEQIYDRRFAQNSPTPQKGPSRAQQHVQSFAKELYNKKVARALCIASNNASIRVNSPREITTNAPLLLEIERSGKLRNVSLIKTSGNYSIDAALLQIARKANIPPVPPEFDQETMHMPMNVRLHMDRGTHNLILNMMY